MDVGRECAGEIIAAQTSRKSCGHASLSWSSHPLCADLSQHSCFLTGWPGPAGSNAPRAGGQRTDSWRAGGVGAAAAGPSRFGPAEPSLDGSRGFGMGRGRGRTGGGLIGGIGAADRTGGGGLSGAAFRAFGSGGGVGGRMRWGSSKAGRRYSTDQLAKLYKQMLYAGR